jgi:hypothetical protein
MINQTQAYSFFKQKLAVFERHYLQNICREFMASLSVTSEKPAMSNTRDDLAEHPSHA